MKLILFATHTEAMATIEMLDAKACEENVYSFDRGWIALSGIGIHAAQQTVCRFASQVEEIWNLGFAGALNENFPLGSLQSISLVGKYVPQPEKLDPISQRFVETSVPHFILSFSGLRLISSDFPIHTPYHRSHLASHWDLVDMEGYGVAFASHYLSKPYQLWKILSDFTSAEGRELIRTHKERFSAALAEKVSTLLSNPGLYAI